MNKEATTAWIAAAIVTCAVPVVLMEDESSEQPPEIGASMFEDRFAFDEVEPTRVPAAPGGEGIDPRDFDDPSDERSTRVDSPAPTGPHVLADLGAMTITEDLLRDGIGATMDRQAHRNVIDFVLQEKAAVGLVVVSPSDNERALGIRDVIIGSVEPALVVDVQCPWHVLRRSEAQAILSGREQTWPDSQQPVRIHGPGVGNVASFFAEMLIPGDRIDVDTVCSDAERVLKAVRGNPNAIGVMHRSQIPQDGTVRELFIEGFRPSRDLRLVYRNEYHPDCAAVMRYWFSPEGRAALSSRLRMR